MNFEDFLSDKHAYQYRGLDDNMPEDFEQWMADLDNQELIDFADEFCKVKDTKTTTEEKLKMIKQISDIELAPSESDIEKLKECETAAGGFGYGQIWMLKKALKIIENS